MKSRETSELIRAYNNIMLRLKTKGIQPKKQMLDNEAPRDYLDTIKEQGLEWELIPPHNHRRNVAKRAIQTAKGHIIVNVMGCDPTFPLKEWHRILPQIEMTLNMLRASNVRPMISAHTYVYRQHDYKSDAIGTIGMCHTMFCGKQSTSDV
jgi:hypothetical protein